MSGGPKILLVEDMQELQQLVTLCLGRSGFQVTAASNGLEALEIAPDFRPALILLDLVMPKMDGAETCRRLKADPRTAAIPVVLMSASAQDETMALGANVGASDYLFKPFNPLTLGAQVQDLLARHGSTDMPAGEVTHGGH